MIKIMRNESGDWFIVEHDGEEIAQGHRPTLSHVRDILEHFGHTVEMQEISDKEMEER